MSPVPHHPHDVPDRATPEPERLEGAWSPEGSPEGWDEGSWEPLVRPAWWRWVALVLIVAMVVATPAAYGMYLILR